MAFGQDDDDSQRVALGLLAGIIGVVVAVVVGFGVYKAQHPAASAAGTLQQAERTATVAAVAPAPDGAGVVVENGVVKFYFATGKADLADGANAALADAVAAAKSGKRLAVSGYHDSTGNAELNAELSKQRAFAVRDALLALGVAEEAVVLQKPEDATGTGSADEARRVEVVILEN